MQTQAPAIFTKSATKAQSVPNRAALQAELEATRTAFHSLLDSISDDRWREKSRNTKWTIGELMVHITWALEQLPQEIASARHGKGMFNYSKRLADPVGYWINRWLARNETRESVGRRYDAAMNAVIRALAEVKDADWACGADFYGERYYTVADLFHTPAEHFAGHTVGL